MSHGTLRIRCDDVRRGGKSKTTSRKRLVLVDMLSTQLQQLQPDFRNTIEPMWMLYDVQD